MLPPHILPLRLLENAHDGAIPPDLLALSEAGNYTIYLQRIARMAEHRFHRRILGNLQLLAVWRCRASSHRWHRLRSLSDLVAHCRNRARAAHDLLPPCGL